MSIYISNIELYNIRAIKSLKLPKNKEKLGQHTVIIGTNSTCKSTILKAITIGLCDRTSAPALLAELPGSIVGDSSDTAKIKIVVTDENNNTIKIDTVIRSRSNGKNSKRSNIVREDLLEKREYYKNDEKISPSDTEEWELLQDLFVCGYGPGRAVGGSETWSRYRLVDSVYTLFRYDQSLWNTEIVVRRASKHYSKETKEVIIEKLLRILGLNDKHKISTERYGLTVSGPKIGKNIHFDAIADGFKSTMTWISDLLGWAMLSENINLKTGDITGLVFIDEIAQHIHPSLQSKILGNLNAMFPSLQIIATTHSPLVALSANEDDLVVLKRGTKYVSALEEIPDFSNYTAEEMLEDPLLFASPIVSPKFKKKIKEYRILANKAIENRTKSEEDKLKLLAIDLGSIPKYEEEKDPLLEEIKNLRKDLGLDND